MHFSFADFPLLSTRDWWFGDRSTTCLRRPNKSGASGPGCLRWRGPYAPATRLGRSQRDSGTDLCETLEGRSEGYRFRVASCGYADTGASGIPAGVFSHARAALGRWASGIKSSAEADLDEDIQ